MTDAIPQAYPLHLADWNGGAPRYGRVVHWRQDRPRVVFQDEDGAVAGVASVPLDDRGGRYWLHDDPAELRSLVERYRAAQA
jgi:hypothetical protein